MGIVIVITLALVLGLRVLKWTLRVASGVLAMALIIALVFYLGSR